MEKMMAAAQIKSYEFGMINGIMDSVTDDFKWLWISPRSDLQNKGRHTTLYLGGTTFYFNAAAPLKR